MATAFRNELRIIRKLLRRIRAKDEKEISTGAKYLLEVVGLGLYSEISAYHEPLKCLPRGPASWAHYCGLCNHAGHPSQIWIPCMFMCNLPQCF